MNKKKSFDFSTFDFDDIENVKNKPLYCLAKSVN